MLHRNILFLIIGLILLQSNNCGGPPPIVEQLCNLPSIRIEEIDGVVSPGDEIELVANVTGNQNEHYTYQWDDGLSKDNFSSQNTHNSTIMYIVPPDNTEIDITVILPGVCDDQEVSAVAKIFVTLTPTPSLTSHITEGIPSPTKTLTPTYTATPTVTTFPTITATPTVTIFPTPSIRPSPLPPAYPSVNLISEQSLPCDKIKFNWVWDGKLHDDMYFAFRIGPPGEERSQTWTQDTEYILTFGNEYFPDNTTYSWYVVVIRDLEGDRTGANGGWVQLTEKPLTRQITVPAISCNGSTPSPTPPTPPSKD